MRKIFTKVACLLLSISFVSSISTINSKAVSAETEKLTQEIKSLSIRAKENEEKAKKELEEALENYLALARALSVDNTELVSNEYYKKTGRRVECQNRVYENGYYEIEKMIVKREDLIKQEINKMHSEVMNTYNKNINLYNKNLTNNNT